MSLCTLSVFSYEWDNTQKRIHLFARLVVSGTVYPAGGIPLDSVLLALPELTTSSGIGWTVINSIAGSGYIYQRIKATGTMMVLQVPPNGSLTTAAPLQQFPSSGNVQGIVNDNINLHCTVLRNS